MDGRGGEKRAINRRCRRKMTVDSREVVRLMGLAMVVGARCKRMGSCWS